MARSRKRTTDQHWTVSVWHNRATCSMSSYGSLDHAVQASYRTFVDGDGYPEEILTPERVRIGYHGDEEDNEREHSEPTDNEYLPALWDQWLEHHPDERAAWDTGSRTARLQALTEQHMPNPRPFTSESIVTNPAWYRRLYGILGMTDEVFETFLSLHRFAIA
jgi:hypothetical protein